MRQFFSDTSMDALKGILKSMGFAFYQEKLSVAMSDLLT